MCLHYVGCITYIMCYCITLWSEKTIKKEFSKKLVFGTFFKKVKRAALFKKSNCGRSDYYKLWYFFSTTVLLQSCFHSVLSHS